MSVRSARGREVERFAMTCTNPGLDRWEAMVKIGEHSNLKPWDADYAAVKRKLGEWQIVVEGWEDTYQSWLHDAAIKVEVNDDVENALESGARLLARWADAKDSKLSTADKKVLRDAAKAMEDKSLSAEERLAAAQSSDIERLHETNPLRDGLSESNPQRFRVERPKSSFASWYQSSRVPKAPTTAKTARSFPATSRRRSPAWNVPQPKASTLCICRRSSRLA